MDVTPESIAREGLSDPDRPVLKGGGRQFVKSGDFETAVLDFARLKLSQLEIRERTRVRTGRLADGRMVIVRPVSEPTLEVQADGRPQLKIRYRS